MVVFLVLRHKQKRKQAQIKNLSFFTPDPEKSLRPYPSTIHSFCNQNLSEAPCDQRPLIKRQDTSETSFNPYMTQQVVPSSVTANGDLVAPVPRVASTGLPPNYITGSSVTLPDVPRLSPLPQPPSPRTSPRPSPPPTLEIQPLKTSKSPPSAYKRPDAAYIPPPTSRPPPAPSRSRSNVKRGKSSGPQELRTTILTRNASNLALTDGPATVTRNVSAMTAKSGMTAPSVYSQDSAGEGTWEAFENETRGEDGAPTPSHPFRTDTSDSYFSLDQNPFETPSSDPEDIETSRIQEMLKLRTSVAAPLERNNTWWKKAVHNIPTSPTFEGKRESKKRRSSSKVNGPRGKSAKPAYREVPESRAVAEYAQVEDGAPRSMKGSFNLVSILKKGGGHSPSNANVLDSQLSSPWSPV